ncbi:MAG: hypothetical protein R2788_23990 [Saprospiraceae bacterium]
METLTLIKKQLVAEGLSFPTSLCFDPQGNAYVAESGLPWDGAGRGGRVFRLLENGEKQLLADGLLHPINGLCWHHGSLIVSEGGYPGRISRLSMAGERVPFWMSCRIGQLPHNMVAPARWKTVFQSGRSDQFRGHWNGCL